MREIVALAEERGRRRIYACRERRARAIVEATTHFEDAALLARVSAGLGEPMVGISAAELAPEQLLETRGW